MNLFAAIAVLLTFLISLWTGCTAVLAATGPNPLAASSSLLPSYPSGDLKLYHFPGNVTGNVGFTPDGSAYSLVRSGILRIAPDGTKTFVNTGSFFQRIKVGGRIVYSNGFLWYEVYQGLVRMHPDGTDPRYLQVPFDFGQRALTNLTAGADGIYYTYYNTTADGTGPVLASITNAFVKTLYPLVAPVPANPSNYNGPPVGSIVYGPDGNVYFEYRKLSGTVPFHFGRVTPSGAVTLFSNPNRCGAAAKFVYAKGSFYFRTHTVANGPTPGTNTLCRVAPSTGQYTVVLTNTTSLPNNADLSLVADNDGNLWTAGFFGVGLFSYAIATGAVTGPIDPNVVNPGYSYLYIGPDQNIYFFGNYASNQLFFGAYVRHQMSFTPSVVGLLPSDAAMNFYVSEPIAGGPWSAVSLNPAIATVTPISSSVGRFSVTEVGHGSTSIKVTDVYGNVQYVPVTAN